MNCFAKSMKVAALAIALSTVTACVYVKEFQPLDAPRLRAVPSLEYVSTLDMQEGAILSTSIGDTLFTLERYTLSPYELVAHPNDTPISPWPSLTQWSATHYLPGPNGKHLLIYTTPDYHSGGIGVALDQNGALASMQTLNVLLVYRLHRNW